MPEATAPAPQTADGEDRFDAESVRRILRRAAEEQHRLDSRDFDSYSLEELEEIATETGISREAVRAAVEAHRGGSAAAAAGPAHAPEPPARGWLAVLEGWMPARWSRPFKQTVLVSAGIVLFVVLLSLPVVGPVLFWVTLVVLMTLTLLFLLGVSFF